MARPLLEPVSFLQQERRAAQPAFPRKRAVG